MYIFIIYIIYIFTKDDVNMTAPKSQLFNSKEVLFFLFYIYIYIYIYYT